MQWWRPALSSLWIEPHGMPQWLNSSSTGCVEPVSSKIFMVSLDLCLATISLLHIFPYSAHQELIVWHLRRFTPAGGWSSLFFHIKGSFVVHQENLSRLFLLHKKQGETQRCSEALLYQLPLSKLFLLSCVSLLGRRDQSCGMPMWWRSPRTP